MQYLFSGAMTTYDSRNSRRHAHSISQENRMTHICRHFLSPRLNVWAWFRSFLPRTAASFSPPLRVSWSVAATLQLWLTCHTVMSPQTASKTLGTRIRALCPSRNSVLFPLVPDRSAHKVCSTYLVPCCRTNTTKSDTQRQHTTLTRHRGGAQEDAHSVNMRHGHHVCSNKHRQHGAHLDQRSQCWCVLR